MVKAMRVAGGASSLVIGMVAAVLTVALPGYGGQAAATAPLSATSITGSVGSWGPGVTSGRSVRLEDFQRDGRRQDEQHLRKREWHRHWDNRLDFWDPSHGRKVFVG